MGASGYTPKHLQAEQSADTSHCDCFQKMLGTVVLLAFGHAGKPVPRVEPRRGVAMEVFIATLPWNHAKAMPWSPYRDPAMEPCRGVAMEDFIATVPW